MLAVGYPLTGTRNAWVNFAPRWAGPVGRCDTFGPMHTAEGPRGAGGPAAGRTVREGSPPMAARQATIPLFALEGVVLFPHVYLPLHIFEPRYRQMVRDAAAADGRIGIIAYDVSGGDDYDEADRLLETGCLAVMEDVQPLSDGRFNIVLRGLDRFRVLDLLPGKPYRQATIEFLPEAPGPDPKDALRTLAWLRDCYRYLNPEYERFFRGLLATGKPETAVASLTNNLINLLDLSFEDRQALLEMDGAADRLAALAPVLDAQLVRSRLVHELADLRPVLEQQDPSLN